MSICILQLIIFEIKRVSNWVDGYIDEREIIFSVRFVSSSDISTNFQVKLQLDWNLSIVDKI